MGGLAAPAGVYAPLYGPENAMGSMKRRLSAVHGYQNQSLRGDYAAFFVQSTKTLQTAQAA
ncbi:MAG: hypothetical protein EBU59_03790 [Planctomycetia bacterium]|nr:hypothetical protein [Planctomycetia bacterium]